VFHHGLLASDDQPAVIEPSPKTKTPAGVGLRDVLCGVAVAALAAILYIATLQPDLGGPEDTPKFQFLGYVFGTAHPPGYPLYSMLSGVFVHLVPIGSVAYRANLFSAVMAALACMTAFLIARLLGASRWTAGCAALGLATGVSFWRSAVFAEVYSLAAAAAGLSLTLLLVWGERLRASWLLAAVAATAAAFGNHLTIVGVVPAYVVYVLARHWRVLTPRVVAIAGLIVAFGFAQYGFIILRTRQHALYLESRATSFSELVEIVTAQRFAEVRFAYSLSTLLTVQLPVVTETMEEDLRLGGLLLVSIGLVSAVRRQRGGALLTIGAGVGMLWMVVNLGGDVKGFITPVMVFVWPFAAVGADALCRTVAALSRRQAIGLVAGGLAAAALPIVNLAGNYKDADQSGQRENAEFFRALHAQLPDGAGVVTEDYFYDMSFYYYRLTGEAPGGKRLYPVSFEAPIVRATARTRPVYAFAGAATFFAVDGLQFVPIAIEGMPLEEWLARLPKGTVLVGATSYLAGPVDLSPIGHPKARPAGRAQNFETFAAVAGQLGESWGKDYRPVTMLVDQATLGAPLPAFGGTVRATADERGARIELGEQTVVSTPSGLALAAFWHDGTLMRALDFADRGPWKVPFHGAVYRLAGELPCVTVARNAWVDVSPAFSTGSAVATLLQKGTVVIETRFAGDAPINPIASGIHGDADARTQSLRADASGGPLWTTELTRSGGRRTVFRFALDRPGVQATARLTSEGEPSINLCSQPPTPLFRDQGAVDVIRPHFDHESYYGAGWSDVQFAGTGRIRFAAAHAALLLPLEPDYSYRIVLDLSGPAHSRTSIALNGVPAGNCSTGEVRTCAVEVQPLAGAGPVSALTLVTLDADGAPIPQPRLMFRGARIERTAVRR
jgi:hypothetical protein